MSEVKILDCTLRDGGYVNKWDFGEKNILKITKNLMLSGIEYIECGFLKEIEYNKSKSLFSDLNFFIKKFSKIKNNIKLALMVNFGEYDIKKIPKCEEKNIIIRLAFKKFNIDAALKYAQQLKDLDYEIFLNPCVTSDYTKKELVELLHLANLIKPMAFSYVDTMGAENKDEILKTYKIIDKILDKNIDFCLHLHDNLATSFNCAKAVINNLKDRNLIIDSTLFGMGRGAGNVKTEEIIKYLNNNFNKKYDEKLVLKTINETIKPFFFRRSLGAIRAISPWCFK